MAPKSNSKQGYERQREFTARILKASEGMSSITHEDSKGRPIRSMDDVRHGADMGIDMKTTIDAKSNQALSRVRNKFNSRLQGGGT